MFDEKRFRALVVLSGMSLQQVAAEFGINEATLYRKMKGKSDFYRKEIQQLCTLLSIEDPASVFLPQILRKHKRRTQWKTNSS